MLHWLACLPLLEEHHLTMLVGTDAWTTREVLRELHGQGWVTSLVLDSPEFASPRRLYCLTDAGIAALAEALRLTLTEVRQRYPVGNQERSVHITRAETAVGIASFAVALRNMDETEEVHVRSSHWTPHPGRPSDPPAVEAHGCLHAGGTTARFVLVWDRAAAPAAHRRGRVAAWYRADEGVYRDISGRLPSLLVVCPDERTLQHWTIAVERGADRRARNMIPLHLATIAELAAQGPFGACWRQPGSGHPVHLADCLAWRLTTSACIETSTASPAALPVARTERDSERQDGTRRGGGALAQSGDPRRRATRAERWAALAIGLSATQKTLLEWVAHHPLLPATHLASHLALSTPSVTGFLEELARSDLVTIDRTELPRSPNERRYVLSADGAAFLAARDGVPVGVYLREGVMAADDVEVGARRATRPGAGAGTPVRLGHLRRHLEHTIGVQRFALALTQEAARQRAFGWDHRLLAWLNDAEGQVWFRDGGRTHHIWPDGRFWYRANGVVYDLLLEWDRGLVRHRDYARKFAAYAAYLTAQQTSQGGQLRLVVATTEAAASRVRAVVAAASQHCPELEGVTRIISHRVVEEGRITAVL
ncbi:MAG: replication-relaxation family protein [Dehalococcoidia bacterium]